MKIWFSVISLVQSINQLLPVQKAFSYLQSWLNTVDPWRVLVETFLHDPHSGEFGMSSDPVLAWLNPLRCEEVTGRNSYIDEDQEMPSAPKIKKSLLRMHLDDISFIDSSNLQVQCAFCKCSRKQWFFFQVVALENLFCLNNVCNFVYNFVYKWTRSI